MRLYAKVTSDRATKGQGGNKYLCISLTVQNGSRQDYPIGEIVLDYMDDHTEHKTTQNEWILKYIPFDKGADGIQIIAQGNVEPPKTKGEKQKGEKVRCNHCNHMHIETIDNQVYECKKCKRDNYLMTL